MNKGKRIFCGLIGLSLCLTLFSSCDLEETQSKLQPAYKSSPTSSNILQTESEASATASTEESQGIMSETNSQTESFTPNPEEVGNDVTDNVTGEIIYIDGVGYDVLSVVNKNYILPEDFKAPNLVTLPESTTDREDTTYKADARAAAALAVFLGDARQAGHKPIVYSAYRTYEKQKNLYENALSQWLESHPGATREDAINAVTDTAPTGTSEHCTGLAFDIYSWSAYNEYGHLDEGFENYELGKWLAANAHKYGFIMRYPKGKEEITMISYEPWHFRYVGIEAATEIYNGGLCLEEYTGKLG